MFLDSDDILVQNACEVMYNKIEEKNADYIVGNYINMDEDGRDWDKPIFPFEKYQETKLSIKDYKMYFSQCKNGHKVDNILLSKFNKTQEEDILKYFVVYANKVRVNYIIIKQFFCYLNEDI